LASDPMTSDQPPGLDLDQGQMFTRSGDFTVGS
jgi:hypothetical protein